MPPTPHSHSLEARQDHDRGVPTVAFASLDGVTSCSGPVNIVLFHSGSFRYADRLISIVVSSTSLANPRVDFTVAPEIDVLDQGIFTWPQVTLPSGQYVLNGTAVSSGLSRTVFVPSTFFAVEEGPDTSCLDYPTLSTSSTASNYPSLTPSETTTTTTPASLSPDAPEDLSETISTTTTQTSTPTLTTPQLHASDSVSTSTSTSTTTTIGSALSRGERTAVIVGSVAGALILVAFLTLVMWCCRRRPRSYRDEKMPPGWKRISALDTATTLNAPQRRPTMARRHPTLNLAVVPPDFDPEDDEKAERPAVMVEVTRHSAEAAGLGAQSMYLTVPANVTYATRGESSTSRFLPSDYDGTGEGGREGERSRADSRVTVGSSRWGWTVPITPLFNLVMSRRSSNGSGRFLSPGGALETPRPDVLAFPERPRTSSNATSGKSMQSSNSVSTDSEMRACARSGDLARATRENNAYDRYRLHSLSDFQWAGFASRAPSQTFSSFSYNLDVSSDRSAPVLDALPEIPNEGSGSETETEGAPRRRAKGLLPTGRA